MPSDRSRSTDLPRNGYTGLVAQQGRVILDRDVNALQGLTAARIAADALDVVGPCGTPDDGFRISLPQASPPESFWSPPVGLPPSSPPEAFGGEGDLLVAPGTMYLGGQRVFWPGEQDGAAVTYSYFDQPDWPLPDPPGIDLVRELVYLDVAEQEVSAVEDPDLLEVALGGPDTTQRLKLLSRVKRLGGGLADCAGAWQQAVAAWAQQGLAFDPATMQLNPAARLKIGFTEDASDGDPCDPVATGGYLGADNQLIRVRTVSDSTGTSLLWGYDNASFLYRITSVSADGTMLTLASAPPDAFHAPQTGQVVEILTTAAVLGKEPDESDPLGEATILRVAAGATGELHALAQPYGPLTQGDPASYIVLADPVAAATVASPLPLFLRVWQAQLPLDGSGGAVALLDPTTGISTGVTVAVTADGKTMPDGAFWQIAVRPATPQGVYPERFLTAPQPPDGPRRWACPLAVVDWTAEGSPGITDCRNSFDNLVALSRRKPGCCTISVSAADVTESTRLQSLIDAAVAKAETVTICLGAGVYALPEPLNLDARHAGLTLESCGGPAIVCVNGVGDMAALTLGLITVTEVQGITLRGLTIEAPLLSLPAAAREGLLKGLQATTSREAAGLFTNPRIGIGIHAFDAAALTLDGCTIAFDETAVPAGTDAFGACIMLQGDCSGFVMKGCTLASALPCTYTATPVVAVAAQPAAAGHAVKTVPAQATTRTSTLLSSLSSSRRIDALTTLLSARAATGFAEAQGTVVATVGIAACGFGDATATGGRTTGTDGTITGDSCALGAVSLRDNRFQGLSFAGLLDAQIVRLRLEDNDVAGGIAGFWVIAPAFGTPFGTIGISGEYDQTFYDFQEFMLLFAMITTLGLSAAMQQAAQPSPARRRVRFSAGAALAAQAQSALVSSSLFVSNNDIAVGIPPANTDGNEKTLIGSSALVLALSTGDTPSGLVSVVTASNRLLSSSRSAPTALFMLPTRQPCAITGNVIVNLLLDNVGASLWLSVEQSENGAALVGVTGNVLSGRHDLDAFPPLGTQNGRWSSYNSAPN